MSDSTKRLCREVECAGGQRVPTGRTEALTNDEVADRNRALVASTLRWYVVSTSEADPVAVDAGRDLLAERDLLKAKLERLKAYARHDRACLLGIDGVTQCSCGLAALEQL